MVRKYQQLIAVFSFFIFFLPLRLFSQTGNKDFFVEKITSKHYKNLFKVNNQIYRSEQPLKKAVVELEELGVKTILNLRRKQTDKTLNWRSQPQLVSLPINTSKISEEDIFKALQIIQQSEKPILIHCYHGSDRTGAIIAAYRLVFQDWEKDKAVREILNPNYGFHKFWFPNIINLIRDLDIISLKQKLKLNDE